MGDDHTPLTAHKPAHRNGLTNANQDLVAGFVTLAAIVLFVTNGGVVAEAIGVLTGESAIPASDRLLTTALLLNIALVLFGWRRYSDLRREIVERTEAEAKAQTLANIDPLTGFHNRRSLHVDGERLVSEARMAGRSVVVLLLDLDNFKNVNDAHGHATGDALLGQVADTIRSALPGDALIARLGGDEFVSAIALTNEEVYAGTERVAARLVRQLARPFVVDGHTVHIGASIGLTLMESDTSRIDALVRRADLAMYAAKRGGRNRFAWFEAEMEQQVRKRGVIEQGIRLGLPRGEFVPFFEPQVDLKTGVLTGFEVLARWNSPTNGLVMPDVFVPVAEENGQIAELSTEVARQGLIAARDWNPGLSIAINVSPLQLRDPWLAQKIVKMLNECGFPPERLEIEFTETCVFENMELADSTVRSLKNQGVSIALDDFGTGFSSLSHLRSLPLDRIKIDRGFVSTMAERDNSLAIVTAIARLAESLSLPVTAEGVETTETEAMLKELGVARGQGWHYGRALTATATDALLTDGVFRMPDGAATERVDATPVPPAVKMAGARSG